MEREKSVRAPANHLSLATYPIPGRVNIFRGKIQDFHVVNHYWNKYDLGLSRIPGSVMGVSLDSAYYLSDLTFPYPIEFSMMTFPAICGKWQLPSNQGHAQIHAVMDEEANIRFNVCMSAAG